MDSLRREDKNYKPEKDIQNNRKYSRSRSKTISIHRNNKDKTNETKNDYYNNRYKEEKLYKDEKYRREYSNSHRRQRRNSSRSNSDDSRKRYKNNKSRSRNNHRDRSNSRRSRSSKNVNSPVRDNNGKVDYFAMRRKNRRKSKSNSALRVMKLKNIEHGIGVYKKVYDRPHEDNDPNKPELYWDGYQWIRRPNAINTNQTFELLKPGRTIQISNLPLELNLDVYEFRNFIFQKMYEKNIISKSDYSNKEDKLIKEVEFDTNLNSANIKMESIDIAKKMILMDGIQLLGHTLRVSPFMETKNEENTIFGNQALANSADISAKSAAISYAALNSLTLIKDDQHKGESTALANQNNNNQLSIFGKYSNISLNTSNKIQLVPHEVIKVMNIADSTILSMNKEEYNEMYKDVKTEFEKFGKVVNIFVVDSRNKIKLGATLGDFFIKYQDSKEAELAYHAMRGKRYDGKELKIAFIDEETYLNDIIKKK